jgi:probable addiction module antidote protein
MKTTRMKIDPAKMAGQTIGRINPAQVDATTEAQMTAQMAQDEALAIQDAANVRIKAASLPDFDMAEYLKTDEDVANYLTLVLEENDPAELSHALGTIARARGMTEVARASGLTREALYKALRPTSHPRFDTIARVCTALGVKLVAQPMQA